MPIGASEGRDSTYSQKHWGKRDSADSGAREKAGKEHRLRKDTESLSGAPSVRPLTTNYRSVKDSSDRTQHQE